MNDELKQENKIDKINRKLDIIILLLILIAIIIFVVLMYVERNFLELYNQYGDNNGYGQRYIINP